MYFLALSLHFLQKQDNLTIMTSVAVGSAALQVVFELSKLTYEAFVLKVHIWGQFDRFVNALIVFLYCESCGIVWNAACIAQ